jgi:hypothetical protein
MGVLQIRDIVKHMGRKRTGQADTRWLLLLPTDLAEDIEQRAKDRDISRNETVRRMLRWANAQPHKNTGTES